MVSKSTSFFQTITIFTLLFLITASFFPGHHGATTATTRYKVTRIGAILSNTSRNGKEAKIAMEIAAGNFNYGSKYHKVLLHFINNTGGDPRLAANAAEELIREKDVEALVGMETWEETAAVAEVGNKAKVPVVSLAPSTISQSLKTLQWPYLVQMSSNFSDQISIVAAIIHTFWWRKVIVIYELDRYGGDSGACVALTKALQEIGVEIEHYLALPSFTSPTRDDPQEFIGEALEEVINSKKSRAFILLRSSISLASHLLKLAKQKELLGQDSAWILMEDVTSSLHSLNTSAISWMEGALGIESYYPEEDHAILDFKRQFMQKVHPDETNLDFGISALRAHDCINAIARAADKMSRANKNPNNILLNIISSENFKDLSGQIRFRNGELSGPSSYRVLNVLQKNLTSVGFWSKESGFLEKPPHARSANLNNRSSYNDNMELFANKVKWPGGLIDRVPKGWSMPSSEKPMKIGVPGRTVFEKFVKVDWNLSATESIDPTGHCIDVFLEVVKELEKNHYPLPYIFVAFNGTYNDLVYHVANKTYDAVVGDVTILAHRSKYVEFTQPFAESGLAMIVPKKRDNSWIFLRPFNTEMWAVSCAILMYTVLIVWLLERRQSNTDFQGPWHDQLSVALWFTFSSLFFAQKEQVRSNYTRVVVVVWFFVVLTLTTSYTASLSSMLTVNRLQPNVTDINWLLKHNAKVGCDQDSFICKYLEDVLGFNATNIKKVSSEYEFPGEFESGNITAAFVELPYEKTFINEYCKGYTVPQTTKYKGDRFGGFGFVFQKGSPIATDVSEAILELSEKGVLKRLNEKWFTPSPSCKASQNNEDYATDSLSWTSFWGLYIFSAATSTISFLLFTAQRFYQRWRHDGADANIIAWNNFVTLVRYFYQYKETNALQITPVTQGQSIRVEERRRWTELMPEISEVAPGEN